MLIKISIENFKSFSNLTEFNMVSSSKIRKQSDHRITVGKTKLLKHAVIYGANAAGKSNLIEFFHFFKYVLEAGLPPQSNKLFCRTNNENANRESTFEIQFSINNEFYAYGFSALLSKRIITSEWLYKLNQNGTSHRIFEREHAHKPQVDLSLDLIDNQRFNTYADDFSENEISLFLTELNRGKRYSQDSKLFVFSKVFSWLKNNIIVYTPSSKIIDLKYYYNADSLSKINDLIRTFDTGISDIRIDSISIEEMQKKIPAPIVDDIFKELTTTITQSGNTKASISIRVEDYFFNVSINEKQEYQITTLILHHGSSPYDFTFDEESDGSRRLFDLIDMLLVQGEDIVFAIDELERSLHPMLTLHFLELFTKVHKNQQIQLIFTTHEASIMDQTYFRRDEFWLVERNNKNESIVYPLDRFKERYDKDISKAYLEGRYGAVPMFSKYIISEVE